MCDEKIKDVKLQTSDFLLFINPNAEKPLNQEQLSCFERMGIKFFNQEIGVFNFNYDQSIVEVYQLTKERWKK